MVLMIMLNLNELNNEMREKDAGSSMGINANSGGGKA